MENERERAKKIAAELNLKQKAALLYGRDFWYLRGSAARADLPDILLTDGPHGARKQGEKKDMLGIAAGEKATVYPTGSIAACSWDEELLFQEGQMLGAECREKGVNVLLGPAINHIRDPRGGRNFEYLSEDPLLSGLLAAAYVRGVQGESVGVCVKHFACNSQENYRMIMDGIIDERALREIYLKPFEIAVKNARPFALMTAYNKINGEYCSQNETLMNAAREWGFDGVFLTDWGAMREMCASYRAGLDAECRIAFEEVKEIVFNGEAVTVQEDGYFTDKSIHTARMPNIKKGKNELIVYVPVGKRVGLENMFLLGNFGILVEGRKAKVVACHDKIAFGSITGQGLPFYGAEITYILPFECEGGDLQVVADYFNGAVIGVQLDGEDAGKIAFAPYTVEIPDVEKGKHTLKLTLYATRVNTFGALHDCTDRLWKGANMWFTEGAEWSYEYNLKPVGIMKSPVLKVYK